jgi:hypothetical protein
MRIHIHDGFVDHPVCIGNAHLALEDGTMAELVSRRRLMELAMAGVGAAAFPVRASAASDGMRPQAPNPMYPDGYLKVLGFFPEVDADWYETVHARDFMSFAAPYMARYARNWIKDAEIGEPPAFRVITEIQYKSDTAKNEVRRLMGSAAGQSLLAHTMQHRAARGKPVDASAASEPVPLFSVTPRTLAHHPVANNDSTMERRILVLRRSGDASPSAFEGAAAALAQHITDTGWGMVTSLDVFGTNPQPGPADAIAYVSHAAPGSLPILSSPVLRVVNILRVETRASVG